MELRKLNKDEFELYLTKAISGYAAELVKSGLKEDVAEKEANNSFTRILPDGLDTPNNFIYHAYDQDKLVGFIWYGLRDKESAFIYDFYIEENMRRKGYGKKVMLTCEKEAKAKGIKVMRLHVFGHNIGARKLYESLDYLPTNIQMKKEL